MVMTVDRPTFSESWYRVADSAPRLKSTARTYRQRSRGRLWHVVHEQSGDRFSRLSEAGYRFVALLDGRRTVGDAWRICSEQLGDEAPTQGEAIQILAQLYRENLLHSDLSPDVEGVLRRQQAEKRREVGGLLMNFLFVRLPLVDPNAFLDRWTAVFGRMFSRWGAAVWIGLVAIGLCCVAGRAEAVAGQASEVLDPENLPLLYLCFIGLKVLHEFGHAFVCKRFAGDTGANDEIHTMGVMILVFTPIPYVDVSNAWTLRSRWHRVVVGAAGMMVELAAAAVAAVVWAHTAQGTGLHAVCYNLMFVAGVSSLLFNGNPLLRYDAYYMLSDLLEIPNLAQRSTECVQYLVKRYGWKVLHAHNPARSRREAAWLCAYASLSVVYRAFVCVAIVLFVADKLFVLGSLLAAGAVVAWVGVPLGRLAHYLLVGGEVARVRGWAVGSTLAVLVTVLAAGALIPMPQRARAEGVAEPVRMAVVYAAADGFVRDYLASGSTVGAGDQVLVESTNVELAAERKALLAQRDGATAERRIALTEDPGTAQVLCQRLRALDDKIRRVEGQLSCLALKSELPGTWVCPDVDRLKGAFVRRGDRIGTMIGDAGLLIRVVAGQHMAARIAAEANGLVDIRVKGAPDRQLRGTIDAVLPAGRQELPSAALGYGAGGSVETLPDGGEGIQSAERFFEIRIRPDADSDVRLLSGQRVVVRFEMPAEPLMVQGWRSLLQLFQRRFHI